jgi:molybdenum cofactor biosynthesis enzyme MoaA
VKLVTSLGLNVSLDSIENTTIRKINDGNTKIPSILKGIFAAKKLEVKVNMVVQKM